MDDKINVSFWHQGVNCTGQECLVPVGRVVEFKWRRGDEVLGMAAQNDAEFQPRHRRIRDKAQRHPNQFAFRVGTK